MPLAGFRTSAGVLLMGNFGEVWNPGSSRICGSGGRCRRDARGGDCLGSPRAGVAGRYVHGTMVFGMLETMALQRDIHTLTRVSILVGFQKRKWGNFPVPTRVLTRRREARVTVAGVQRVSALAAPPLRSRAFPAGACILSSVKHRPQSWKPTCPLDTDTRG